MTSRCGARWRRSHARASPRRSASANVALDQLAELVAIASTPIAFVQNRCYASTGWDADVRAFCRQHGIVYQGFSLLTANRSALQRPIVDEIAMRHTVPRETVVFAFAMQIGMIPLTGTSSAQHMRDDLRASEITLTQAELHAIEGIAR